MLAARIHGGLAPVDDQFRFFNIAMEGPVTPPSDGDSYTWTYKVTDWHDDSWRCRLCAAIYRVAGWLGGLADHIDKPERHEYPPYTIEAADES
jgi:hypothetical protein